MGDKIFFGKWRLDEEFEIDGKLEIKSKPNEISLFISKAVLEDFLNGKYSTYFPNAFYGISYNGYNITLLGLSGKQYKVGDNYVTEFRADFVLLNKNQFFANKLTRIKKISFSTNFFPEFLRRQYNRVSQEIVDGKKSFTFRDNNVIPVFVNDYCKIYFDFAGSFSFDNLSEIEFQFSQTIFITLEYPDYVEFDNAISDLFFYKEFFNLFSSSPILLKSIFINAIDNETFDLYINNSIQDVDAPISLGNCFLDFETIKDRIETMIIEWNKLKDYVQKGFDFYLQVRNRIVQNDVHAFLNLVFALETLHTNFFDKEYFSFEQMSLYKNQKKKALEQFDEIYLEKALTCLGSFNKLSLKNRIEDLIQMNTSILSDFIYDANDFSKRVVSQRNFLAHDHYSKKEEFIPKDKYKYFISILKLIYELSLYSLLQLEEEYKLKLTKTRHYTYFKKFIPILIDELLIKKATE